MAGALDLIAAAPRSWLTPPVRSLREFAEQEIIIPSGPYEGRKFRCHRQPLAGLLFDAIDSGRWSRFAIVGPSQSGKTLAGSIIPSLYHLFELGERVIYGVPDLDMSRDKWAEMLMVIERTRYRDYLPRTGGAARGGVGRLIQFANGASLRFMSGRSSDKGRAGYTSRVVVVTEVDGMDESRVASREADPISQLEARTRAYGSSARIYLECTVSHSQGRIWREYQGGTASRIALACPLCGAYVTPEREHLVGWKGAASVVEAASAAAWHCPRCAAPWTEDQRVSANSAGILLHRGQSVGDDGEVVGEPPKTFTLGFRWTAVNNLFVSAGDAAADEWRGERSDDENSEKQLRQFVHCLPFDPPRLELSDITADSVIKRMHAQPRGVVPRDAEYVTVGIDVGKYFVYWVAIAWLDDGKTPRVIEYSSADVPSDDMGVDRAIASVLAERRSEFAAGWVRESSGELVPAAEVWVDSGYQTETVYAFCAQSENWRPIKGRGAEDERRRGQYTRPKSRSQIVRYIGDGYHLDRIADVGVFKAEIDADQWKSRVHSALTIPLTQVGAMTLHHVADARQHNRFGRHMTSEKKVEEFVRDRGVLTRWLRIRRDNHLLDATYIAMAAGDFVGAVGVTPVARRSPAASSTVADDDIMFSFDQE